MDQRAFLAPGIPPITHFFTHFNQLGGVESWLKLHQRNSAGFKLDESFVLVFESGDLGYPNVYTLGQTGLHSVFSARRKFRKIARKFKDSIHFYHNLWGLAFLADLDHSSKRIGVIHSKVDEIEQSMRKHHHLLDRIVTVSQHLRNWVAKVVPEFPSGEISVLPNPVDVPPLTIQSSEGRHIGKIMLGYSGRVLKELKRIDRLPEFLKQLDIQKIDYEFHVLGEGKSLEWLANSIARHPSVIIHGRKDGSDYYRCLSKIDALVFFSDVEGLPISLLEGMAMGIPSFFPRIDSEAVVFSENLDPRLVYPTGNIGRLTNQVIELFERSELAALREKCRDAARPFSLQNHYHSYVQQILTAARRPRVVSTKSTVGPSRVRILRRLIPFGILNRLGIQIQ